MFLFLITLKVCVDEAQSIEGLDACADNFSGVKNSPEKIMTYEEVIENKLLEPTEIVEEEISFEEATKK